QLVSGFPARWLDRLTYRGRRLARSRASALAVMQDFRAIMTATNAPELVDLDRDIAAFATDMPPQKARTPLLDRPMNGEEVWELMRAARAGRYTSIEIVAAVEASLAQRDLAAIERFQSILCDFLARSYHWDLWAVAYAARGGCGDDEFDYFRQWLILQGREV